MDMTQPTSAAWEDYVDDAIHYRRHWWSRKTLCGLAAKPRNVISLTTVMADVHASCWTCMAEADTCP